MISARAVHRFVDGGSRPALRCYDLAANKAREAIRLIAAISPFNDLRMRERYSSVMLEGSDQQTEADD